MSRVPLSRLLPSAACFALLLPVLAGAFADAAAIEPGTHRDGFRHALEMAEAGPLAEYASVSRRYARHPLAPYLDYAVLHRQLDRVQAATIAAFVDRHAQIPIAAVLRTQALFALARRQDWAGFRLLYTGSSDPALRCADLLSRQTTPPDGAWLEAGLSLWLNGHSQPKLCDGVFEALRKAGQLTPERHLERIDLAAEAHELGLMRHLAASLPAAQAARIRSYADFLAAPTAATTTAWPADARSRRIAVLGINRVARRDPGVAEALLASLQERLVLDPEQRGQVLNQIALWSAASYLPDSPRRFAAVPVDAWDERLHEWQARAALARGDDAGTLAAIERMPPTQRGEMRWRYIQARLRERAGEPGARAAFAALAGEASYYGFLAAERIGVPYALCPLDPDDDAAARKRVRAEPGLVRALALYEIDRVVWARREWEALRPRWSDQERRIAVALAEASGWHDRGPLTLRDGDDLRYYPLRFPLPHRRRIEREAKKYGLDPAWIAALIRAESAWAPDARSHADARGLMQLLPATARAEARKRGLRYPGAAGLFKPDANLRIGIAHLASMLEKHGGQPFLATAAYNAGATPVARWLAQRPPYDIDLWIETIPYRETREYVARILAFAVIYDWRLHGNAAPLTARARGLVVADEARRGFTCPTATQEDAP